MTTLNHSYTQQAVSVFKKGGIVIFPTDTAFGIGCRIDRPQSIRKLYQIRRRPTGKPVPVLVSGADMAVSYYLNPSIVVRRLIKKYWPGALTIVAPCQTDKVYYLVCGAGNTIGLRMPNHNQMLDIIEQVGVPILGPSANFHGGQTPYTQNDLDPELVKLADYVMPGKTDLKSTSTVVDCSASPYIVIRSGAIDLPPEVHIMAET